MELVSTKAESYAASFTSPLDTLLQELHDHTLAQHPQAHMLSGAVQGKFLEFFSDSALSATAQNQNCFKIFKIFVVSFNRVWVKYTYFKSLSW